VYSRLSDYIVVAYLIKVCSTFCEAPKFVTWLLNRPGFKIADKIPEGKRPHERPKRRYTNIFTNDADYSATVWTELFCLRLSKDSCLTHSVMNVLLSRKARFFYPSEQMLTRRTIELSSDIQKIFILFFSLSVFE
jgi:hypothetical protein